MITIDGSFGEGGGQVLRTSLALAAITGLSVRIDNIRAARLKPGLQAQHLTSARAAAEICDARLEGAALGSMSLLFEPKHPPRAGEYTFDVTQARNSGSAGATTLVLQTILLPLALAPEGGESCVTIRGGTHTPYSPPFPYIRHIYLPMLWRMGVHAQVELLRYGWYPAGGGELRIRIQARPGALTPIVLTQRGELRKLWGLAAVSNLPSHIAQRMANRAVNVLKDVDIQGRIEAAHVEANGPGAGIFLFAEYEHSLGGFTAYGRKGLPSEQVADMACHGLLSHHKSGAATDRHLADQLILPAGFADGQSRWTTCKVTLHLLTNAWIARQFLDVPIYITGNVGEEGSITVGQQPSKQPVTDHYHV